MDRRCSFCIHPRLLVLCVADLGAGTAAALPTLWPVSPLLVNMVVFSSRTEENCVPRSVHEEEGIRMSNTRTPEGGCPRRRGRGEEEERPQMTFKFSRLPRFNKMRGVGKGAKRSFFAPNTNVWYFFPVMNWRMCGVFFSAAPMQAGDQQSRVGGCCAGCSRQSQCREVGKRWLVCLRNHKKKNDVRYVYFFLFYFLRSGWEEEEKKSVHFFLF